jgi:hypothetical protein
MRILWMAFFGFLALEAAADEWRWTADPKVLNPSGIEVNTPDPLFQFLDWNGDGWLDVVINENGEFSYYQRIPGERMEFEEMELELPGAEDWRQIYSDWSIDYRESVPNDFQFVDVDKDGDLDYVAGWGFVFFNQCSEGSGCSSWTIGGPPFPSLPTWQWPSGCWFYDYDGDGDLDMIARSEWDKPLFYWNDTDKPLEYPLGPWRPDSVFFKVSEYGCGALVLPRFHRFHSDSLPLLIGALNMCADPGLFRDLAVYRNRGTVADPHWTRDQNSEEGKLFWSTSHNQFQAWFQVLDFDGDDNPDIAANDWLGHIALYSSLRRDSIVFQNRYYGSPLPVVLLGGIHGEMDSKPFFHDTDGDGKSDLLVSSDFESMLTIGLAGIDSRVEAYQNRGEQFPTIQNEWIWSRDNWGEALGAAGRTLSIMDADQDGNPELLTSRYYSWEGRPNSRPRVFFFRYVRHDDWDGWEADTKTFGYFQKKDSSFYAPVLADMDSDGDLDILIQKDSVYTFYERLNTADERWRENRTWLSGIGGLTHYSATIADLNLDGKPDIVFGEEDGTLSLYQNIGSPAIPSWLWIPEAFEGIDVGEKAYPAFADITGDRQLDLALGSASGKVYFYRNESELTGVEEGGSQKAYSFDLSGNYPNPFNGATTFSYALAGPSRVRLSVCDLSGRSVAVLFDGFRPAGGTTVRWDGRDGGGHEAPSGIYLARIEYGGRAMVRKMVLAR